jgi:hypothetical protein
MAVNQIQAPISSTAKIEIAPLGSGMDIEKYRCEVEVLLDSWNSAW